jgi:hypothetical protein
MGKVKLLRCILSDGDKVYGPSEDDCAYQVDQGLTYGGDVVDDTIYSKNALANLLNTEQIIRVEETAKVDKKAGATESTSTATTNSSAK